MSKKTLNEANLVALGPEKLATLLIEVSAGSADIKRRLRLELSHNLGSAELAHDVRKRLASIRKSKSYVGWRKRKALVKDLSTQVAMIIDKIGPDDPATAFDLLWTFVELAPSVYTRTDDSKGDVGAVFHDALHHFTDLGPRALPDPVGLADRVWGALQDNDYGEWNDIIPVMAPALGEPGLAALRDLVETHAEAPHQAETEDHEAIQFLRELRGGSGYAATQRARFVKICLQEIAICLGDAGAYIAQYSETDMRQPGIAAEVATLQLENGDAQSALDTLLNADLEAAPTDQNTWDTAYIATLTALGQTDAAQDHRWQCFEDTLSPAHLRDYLKQLPDFEDVTAEDNAKAYVQAYPDVMAALAFFMELPDLLGAAQLIKTRHSEIEGLRYDTLSTAADALRSRQPLAAAILWRAMVESILWHGHTKRYAQAVDCVHDCAAVDVTLEDYEDLPSHDAFLRDLRDRYSRKDLFWAKVVA